MFNKVIKKYKKELAAYCLITIFINPANSVLTAVRIYQALSKLNPSKDKDVLLLLLSPGGQIEPAYQISKLCKKYSKNKFVVAIPRHAKSAATLISLGADEVHMGSLGQLGLIDPQLGGLPALGVAQAIKTLASVAEQYPKSSEMLARYLRMALTVEQIGYCERISVSAAQYADRLLSTKPSLAGKTQDIAFKLVYEYKDHGFVIDADEAQEMLGTEFIKTNSAIINIAERFYRIYEDADIFLRFVKQKKLVIVGNYCDDTMIWDNK